MNTCEHQIISRIIDNVLYMGYTVSLYDGDRYTLRYSTAKDSIMAELGHTGEDVIKIYRHQNNDQPQYIGFIRFIYNGDADVVQDCSDKEEILSLIGWEE